MGIGHWLKGTGILSLLRIGGSVHQATQIPPLLGADLCPPL